MLANLRRTVFGIALTLPLLLLVAPRPAHAHFVLVSPEASVEQDPTTGAPENPGPCGSEGTPTDTVTAVQSGQKITITINEVIFNPGHFRVALVEGTGGDLPVDPEVLSDGDSPCGTTTVQSPPVFPVLADGVLEHSAPLTGPQTIEVTVPSNLTCTHCTLQVTQFITHHALIEPGGCFFHHCAALSIASPVGGDDAGSTGSLDASTPPPSSNPSATDAGDAGAATLTSGGGDDSSGCSTTLRTSPISAAFIFLGALALAGARLRRRR